MKKTSLRTRAALGFSDFQVAGEEDDEAEEDLQVFFFFSFPFLSTHLREHLRQLLFENEREGGILFPLLS